MFTSSFILYFYVENVYIHQYTMVKDNNFDFKQCEIFNSFQFQIKNQLVTYLTIIASLNC